jgi:hypothetical protein
VIKTFILNQSLTQEDLDDGLTSALNTQNKDDIKILLSRGADPTKHLLKTVTRTIDNCLYPESYDAYKKTYPGELDHRGFNYDFSAIPLPSTEFFKILCLYVVLMMKIS